MGKRTIGNTFLISILVLMGCSHFHSGGTIPWENLSVSFIAERIEFNKQKVRTISGRGHLIYTSPEYSNRVNATINLVVPDSLILHIHGPVGTIQASLLIIGSHVTYYNRRDNEQYQGVLNESTIRQLTGFDFLKQDIFEFFTGLIPFEIDSTTHTTFYPEENSYRVLAEQIPYEGVWRFSKNGHYIIESKLYDTEGSVFMEKSAEGFNRVKGIYLPKIIRYKEPMAERELTMVYSNSGRQVNKPIPSKNFKVFIPPTAKMVQVRDE